MGFGFGVWLEQPWVTQAQGVAWACFVHWLGTRSLEMRRQRTQEVGLSSTRTCWQQMRYSFGWKGVSELPQKEGDVSRGDAVGPGWGLGAEAEAAAPGGPDH